MNSSHVRLFFIFARESPIGVIIRRGPTRWVQIIRWNTATDIFEPGAWFHGRLYETRCDLSPDGGKLVYCAAKFERAARQDDDYGYVWTAISKIPWLTALALWPMPDTYHGGGLFETNQRLLLDTWFTTS